MAKKDKEVVTGWAGWIAFASVMLTIAGVFHAIAGLVALFKNTVYIVGSNNLWALDYTQWGWIHLIGGALLIWAASSLMNGKLYGRSIAILIAGLSMIVNMLFIPVYPIWSLMIIAIDIFVMYAVVVHGDELQD